MNFLKTLNCKEVELKSLFSQDEFVVPFGCNDVILMSWDCDTVNDTFQMQGPRPLLSFLSERVVGKGKVHFPLISGRRL